MTKAEILFMKWEADLAEMDRSKPAVEGNFDLLFDQLYRAKVSMNDALPYLDKATKAHYPTTFVIKSTFKRVKHFGKDESVNDFEKSWKELISKAAKRVFFSIYDVDIVETDNKDYGGMSPSEYRKLQKYADSHQTVDWEAIVDERDGVVEEPINTNINLGDL